MRHLTTPPKEEKPYPIHDKHILELASKHVVNLYEEKKSLGPFRTSKYFLSIAIYVGSDAYTTVFDLASV